jgi:hypothetical protein
LPHNYLLAFSLCTLWAVEALTRCGAHDKKLLQRAVSMFEDFLGCKSLGCFRSPVYN